MSFNTQGQSPQNSNTNVSPQPLGNPGVGASPELPFGRDGVDNMDRFSKTLREENLRREKEKENNKSREEREKKNKEDKERNREKYGTGQLNYSQPPGFSNMSLEDYNKFKEAELKEPKHSINVPVTRKDISQILDNYRETGLGENADDTIASMKSKLESINASYEMGNANNNFRSDSIEKKSRELFEKDLLTPWKYFIRDISDNWKSFIEYVPNLFLEPSLHEWKKIILVIILITSYILSTYHNDYNISQIRIIFPNLFLISSIVYAVFSYTKGIDTFMEFPTLVTFSVILLLLSLYNVVDMTDYTTGAFNPSIIGKFIVIPIIALIVINFLILFFNKLLPFNKFLLWIVIGLLYLVDAIVNANNISTSNLIWSLIMPSLLVLLGKTPDILNIPFTEITVGIFCAIMLNELFIYNIENIIFS